MECGDARPWHQGQGTGLGMGLKEGAREGGGNPDCVYVAASVRDREAVKLKLPFRDRG